MLSQSEQGSFLGVEIRGTGEPVLFIAGRAALGRSWDLHQIPAFLNAGYKVITFDNRGTGSTAHTGGFNTEVAVLDTARIIEEIVGEPVRIVGTSMGSYIAQELMLARPDLVLEAGLMATYGRHDEVRNLLVGAERARWLSKVEVPMLIDVKVRLLENLSPATLNDDSLVHDWIDTFTIWPELTTEGTVTQLDIAPVESRLRRYESIKHRVLVIGFADDVQTPPHLGAEVAMALPKGRFSLVTEAGHLGYLEQPKIVNGMLLGFFSAAS